MSFFWTCTIDEFFDAIQMSRSAQEHWWNPDRITGSSWTDFRKIHQNFQCCALRCLHLLPKARQLLWKQSVSNNHQTKEKLAKVEWFWIWKVLENNPKRLFFFKFTSELKQFLLKRLTHLWKKYSFFDHLPCSCLGVLTFWPHRGSYSEWRLPLTHVSGF